MTEPKSKVWPRTLALLKYGAGIIIALISLYGARQDKGREAMTTLKSAYEEQSKQVLELQGAVRKLEDVRKETVAQCRSEIDGMRSNMTFFLMGLSKAKEQSSIAESSEARKLLKALLKEATPASAPKAMKPAFKFQEPRPFEQLKAK